MTMDLLQNITSLPYELPHNIVYNLTYNMIYNTPYNTLYNTPYNTIINITTYLKNNIPHNTPYITPYITPYNLTLLLLLLTLPLLLLIITLPLISLFLPSIISKNTQSFNVSSFKITLLSGIHINNLHLTDRQIIYSVMTAVYPSAGVCEGEEKGDDKPALTSLTIKTITLQWSLHPTLFPLPLPTLPIKPKIPLILPHLTLTVSGLSGRCHKGGTYSGGVRYVYNYSSCHTTVSNLSKNEADGLCGLAESYARRKEEDERVKAGVGIIMRLIRVKGEDFKLRMYGGEEGDVKRYRVEMDRRMKGWRGWRYDEGKCSEGVGNSCLGGPEPCPPKPCRQFVEVKVKNVDFMGKVKLGRGEEEGVEIKIDDFEIVVGKEVGGEADATFDGSNSSSSQRQRTDAATISNHYVDCVTDKTYTLHSVLHPLSACITTPSLPTIISKGITYTPSFMSTAFKYDMTFTELKLDAEIKGLYGCLYMLNDWVGDSDYNDYCTNVAKGLRDKSLLEGIAEDLEEGKELEVEEGRVIKIPKYGPLSWEEEEIYQRYYKIKHKPERKWKRGEKKKNGNGGKGKAESAPSSSSSTTSSNATPSSSTNVDDILTLLECRMSTNEIIYHRVISCPHLYDITKRDSKFEEFVNFYHHKIIDSRGGYGGGNSGRGGGNNNGTVLEGRKEMLEDRPKWEDIEYPPSAQPLLSKVYRHDGEGVIDMMRDLFGAVAPKNIYNLRFSGLKIQIPDVTSISSTNDPLGTDVIIHELGMSIELQSVLTQDRKIGARHGKNRSQQRQHQHQQQNQNHNEEKPQGSSNGLSSRMSPGASDNATTNPYDLTPDRRRVFKFTLEARDVSIKPDRSSTLVSKHTPLLYDGSACALLHRLEPAYERDTHTKNKDIDAKDNVPQTVGNMLEIKFDNYVTSTENILDNRAEVDVLLQDVIVVALPTQLAVTLKGVEAILACPTLSGEQTWKKDDDARGNDNGEKIEGFLDDDESDGDESDISYDDEDSLMSEDDSDGHDDSDDHSEHQDLKSTGEGHLLGERGHADDGDNRLLFPNLPSPSTPLHDLHASSLEVIDENEDENSTVKDTPAPSSQKSSGAKKKNLSKFFGEPMLGDPTNGEQLTNHISFHSPESHDSLPLSTINPVSNDNAVSPLSDASSLKSPSSPTHLSLTPPKHTTQRRRRRGKKRRKGKIGGERKAPPPPPPDPHNGTIFNGADLNYKVSIRNISLALLLDENVLESGLLDINISQLDLRAESDIIYGGEQVKLMLKRLTIRGCSLDGSTQIGSPLRIVHLPFKSAAELGPLNILYSGCSRLDQTNIPTLPQPPLTPLDDRKSLNTALSESFSEKGGFQSPQLEIDGLNVNEDRNDRILGTVFVSIEVGIGSLKLNLTPSLNAVFNGCIASLTKVFSLSEEETRRLEAEKKLKIEEEEMKKRAAFLDSRRQALRHIWRQIDTDGSDSLDQNEVKKVVLCLLEKHKQKNNIDSTPLVVQGKSSQITTKELERELANFMNIVDANHDNNVSFKELEDAMFMMKGSHDEEAAGEAITHGIVYFSNLKEFCSPVIVYEITGVHTQDEFLPPVKWKNPDGIDAFFAIYTSECGCTRTSLKRQDPKVVQRKLVRALQNYNFARFCWESLVEAGLRPPSNPRNLTAGITFKTRWLLEGDEEMTAYRKGAIDILASHVQQATLKKVREKTSLFRFDTSLVLNVEKVVVSAGNALIFSKSLLNVGICDTKVICNLKFVPDSENGWLNVTSTSAHEIPEDEKKDDQGDADENEIDIAGLTGIGETSTNYGLDVHLETRVYVECLNTAHGVMGMILEPWSMFLNFGYTVEEDTDTNTSSDDDDDDGDDNDPESDEGSTGVGKRTSLELKCPDFLKIDFTPETLRTLSLLQKMVQVTPEIFEQLSIERNMENLHEYWLSVDENDDGLLEKSEVIPIVKQFFSTSWRFMPEEQLDEMVDMFISRVDIDGDGCISYWELEEAVRSRTMNAKSIFESSSLIRFRNTTGHPFFFGSVAKNSSNKDVSQTSFDGAVEDALDSFDICQNGRTRPLKLGKDITQRKSNRFFTRDDTISLKFQHFKNINNITVPAFQKIIFPLTYIKPSQWSPASRFAPTLTLSPNTDPLETVTLTVRSSFLIEAHTAIVIEIFKVKGTLKRGLQVEEQMRYCLQKAEFVMRLELNEGENAGIPLNVVLSSSIHFLRIRDVGQVKWRDPVIIDRDFLWNPTNKMSVSKAHLNLGIQIVRMRLIQEIADEHREISSSNARGRGRSASFGVENSSKLDFKVHGSDTTIRVLPSAILSNSLPFNIRFHCYQKGGKGSGSAFSSLSPGSSMIGGAAKLENKRKVGVSRGMTSFSNNVASMFQSKTKSFKPTSSSWSRESSGGVLRLAPHSISTPFNSKGTIRVGSQVKLTGIDLSEKLWISISREDGSSRESKPIELNLPAMEGGKILPIVRGILEDEINFKVNGVHLKNTCKVLNIFSPYWVVNKTGMSLSYRVSGRSSVLHDTTLGNAPVLVDSSESKSLGSNWDGHWIQAIPNQGVYTDKLKEWWNEKENGVISVRRDLLNAGSLRGKGAGKGISLNPEYCEKIGLDNVGQVGEVNCGNIYFGVTVDTMTGAFHESNLMTFSPRFVVRNNYKTDITIVPLEGSVKSSSKIVDKDWNAGKFKNLEIQIKQGEASVVYSFNRFGHSANISKFIAVRTTTSSVTGDGKYDGNDFEINYRTHIVPVGTLGTMFFSERAGMRVADIVRTKNTKSGATTIITVDQANGGGTKKGGQPPYRLENRSTDTTVIAMQDDDDADPVMLHPMTWCSFAYDNPHGRLRIKCVGLNNDWYGYVKDKVDGLVDSISKPPKRTLVKNKKKKFRQNFATAKDKFSGRTRAESRLKAIEKEEAEETPSARERSESEDSSIYSSYTLAQKTEIGKNKKIKDFRAYMRALGSSKSRSYNIDKVGQRKNLPSAFVTEGGKVLKRGDDILVECRIKRGTKVVSFNDSMFRISKMQQDHRRSGGDWMGVSTHVKIEGLIVNLVDQQPQEVLSICLRDLEIEKEIGNIDIMCRLRHLQIDNMLEDARYPIVLQPASDSIDIRTQELREKQRQREAAENIITKEGDMFWEQLDVKPKPLFEMSLSYLPLQHMTWVPALVVFLNPLNLKVDLAYFLFVVDVVQDALGTDGDLNALSPQEVEEAYHAANQNMEKIVGSDNLGQLAYVEKLEVNETFLQLELFLRQEISEEIKHLQEEELEKLEIQAKRKSEFEILNLAEDRKGEWAKLEEIEDTNSQDDEDEIAEIEEREQEVIAHHYDENVEASNLSAIGRGTKSTWGASLLTWLTNVASSFAQVSPTFTFKELNISGHFGRTDELTDNIVRHYITNLLYQSYKLFSFHLLGDPFSLLDSITTGAMQFITITRDEMLAKGKHGVGGGVKKLVQGVVGGTTKSTAMVLGSAADIISQVSGNGAVMDSTGTAANRDGPKHVGEGLIVGSTFFGKHLVKGIVGVLAKPVKGAKNGPIGLVSGVWQGVSGLAAAPFIATFGSVSKVAESIDATTHIFDHRIVNCRVRPRRNFGGWGTARMPISVPCIKGIGIRIHNLQYITENQGKHDGKKIIKLIGADGHKYKLKAKRPVIIRDKKDGRNGRTIEYVVVFEDTLVVRSRDLQVYDELRIEVWDKKLNSTSPLALTYIRVDELLLDIKEFNDEKKRVIKSFYKKNCRMLTEEDMMIDEEGEHVEGLDMVSHRRKTSTFVPVELGELSKGHSVSELFAETANLGMGTHDDLDALSRQTYKMQRAIQDVTPSINEHIVYSASASEGNFAKGLKIVGEGVKMATHSAKNIAKEVMEPAKGGAGIRRFRQAGQRILEQERTVDLMDNEAEHLDDRLGGSKDGEVQYLALEENEQREMIRAEGKPWGVLKISVFPIEY